MVKRRDIVSDLTKLGATIIEGKRNNRHAKVVLNNRKAPLPRHREVTFYTLKELYKQLGLDAPNHLTK